MRRQSNGLLGINVHNKPHVRVAESTSNQMQCCFFDVFFFKTCILARAIDETKGALDSAV